MTILKREPFLQTIAEQLGRSTTLGSKPERKWKHLPQHEVLKTASADELLKVLIEQCKNIHTDIHLCTRETLQETLSSSINNYGNGKIIYSDDERFSTLQVKSFLSSLPESYQWLSEEGKKNVEIAEQANIGVVISEITLAESGTIMLQTDAHKGRVISFLPTNSIAIIPKSSIVPRMTQAAKVLRSLNAPVSSCINFITGPSNSADIEMNLVVGVHGPVRMTYIVVEDC